MARRHIAVAAFALAFLWMAGCMPIQAVQPGGDTPLALDPDATDESPFDLNTALQGRMAACVTDDWEQQLAPSLAIAKSIYAAIGDWLDAPDTPALVQKYDEAANALEALPANECLDGIRLFLIDRLRLTASTTRSVMDLPSLDATVLAPIATGSLVDALATHELLTSAPSVGVFLSDRYYALATQGTSETPPAGIAYQFEFHALDEYTECTQATPYELALSEAIGSVQTQLGLTQPPREAPDCTQFPIVTERRPVQVRYTIDGPPGALVPYLQLDLSNGVMEERADVQLPFVLDVTMLTGDRARLFMAFIMSINGQSLNTCSVTADGKPLQEFDAVDPGIVTCGGYLRE